MRGSHFSNTMVGVGKEGSLKKRSDVFRRGKSSQKEKKSHTQNPSVFQIWIATLYVLKVGERT